MGGGNVAFRLGIVFCSVFGGSCLLVTLRSLRRRLVVVAKSLGPFCFARASPMRSNETPHSNISFYKMTQAGLKGRQGRGGGATASPLQTNTQLHNLGSLLRFELFHLPVMDNCLGTVTSSFMCSSSLGFLDCRISSNLAPTIVHSSLLMSLRVSELECRSRPRASEEAAAAGVEPVRYSAPLSASARLRRLHFSRSKAVSKYSSSFFL